MNNYKNVSVFMLMLLLQACASSPVEPWEKDVLARPDMKIVPNKLIYYYDEHTYFSREASIGGTGSGGGGCGCN
jgi:hypothetical protein